MGTVTNQCVHAQHISACASAMAVFAFASQIPWGYALDTSSAEMQLHLPHMQKKTSTLAIPGTLLPQQPPFLPCSNFNVAHNCIIKGCRLAIHQTSQAYFFLPRLFIDYSLQALGHNLTFFTATFPSHFLDPLLVSSIFSYLSRSLLYVASVDPLHGSAGV